MKGFIGFWSTCILGTLFVLIAIPAWANGAIASREEAMSIADREMDKLGFKQPEWKSHIDENNAEWKEVSALRLNSPISEAREYFEKQESKLRGHKYWAVHYEHLTPPGVEEKDGEVWVFIARDSGRVLLVIPPGH